MSKPREITVTHYYNLPGKVGSEEVLYIEKQAYDAALERERALIEALESIASEHLNVEEIKGEISIRNIMLQDTLIAREALAAYRKETSTKGEGTK